MQPALHLFASVIAIAGLCAAPAIGAPAITEHASCQPSAPIRAELAKLDPDLSGCPKGEPCRAEARARLQALLDEHGFDMHLAGTLTDLDHKDGVRDRETIAADSTATAEALGDNLDAWFLAGAAQTGEAGEATLRDKVLAVDPDHPWAHLAIAARHLRDGSDVTANALRRFLQQCPSQLREAANYTQRVGDAEYWRPLLPALVEATLALPEAERIATLPTLWQVQFTGTPLDRHDTLRGAIGDQVIEIRQLERQQSPIWWDTLAEGYELLGTERLASALAARRMERFPCHRDSVAERVSRQILDIVPDASDMRIKAARVDIPAEEVPSLVAALDALHAECPKDQTVLNWRFRLLEQEEAPSAERIVAVSEAYLEGERRRTGMNLSLPDYEVARLFVERGVAWDRVPALVESARKTRPDLSKLRMPERFRTQMGATLERKDVLMAQMAAVARQELGETAAARDEAAEAARLYRALDPEIHADHLPDLHAKLAPVLADVDLPSLPVPAAPESEVAETTAAGITGWSDVEQPLTLFAVSDLDGRSWSLDDLTGQGVLLNFWATWCAPCIAEMPEIQALHDELEDVEGLTVLTINIDRNVGKVQPFLAKKDYDFPVLLAPDFLPVDDTAIPQNWVLDRQSVVRKKSRGFAVEGEGVWRHDALRVLREVAGDTP